jgi:hypothetical protein
MSGDTPSTGDAHVVDVAEAFPDPVARNHLIAWGAKYLSSSSEDVSIRVASLTLEYAGLIWKQARYRGRRMSRWQVKLLTIAMIVECVRQKQLLEEANASVRH